MLRVATHKTEKADHDFCLSGSHYIKRERVRLRGIERFWERETGNRRGIESKIKRDRDYDNDIDNI